MVLLTKSNFQDRIQLVNFRLVKEFLIVTHRSNFSTLIINFGILYIKLWYSLYTYSRTVHYVLSNSLPLQLKLAIQDYFSLF